MNTIHRALIAAGLMVTATAASAAVTFPATASASIDWSGLTISTIGLGGTAPGYTLNEGSDYASVDYWDYGAGYGDYDSAPDWSTGTSASASGSGWSATAMTTASTLSAEVSGGSGFEDWVSANRDGSIDITGGPGLLVVSVPYSLEISYDTLEGGLASAWASIALYNETSGSSGYGDGNIGWWDDEEGSVFDMADGFISASVYVEDGDSVMLDGWVQAEASAGVVATPLPAAAWMFGAAVIAFGGMASRRRA
jgi:hypothetical protein